MRLSLGIGIVNAKTASNPLFDGNILNLYAEHAANHLTIPTPPTNAEGGVTHPDVIDFDLINGDKWNGYRYWMAFTPLPTLNPDPNENPCVVVSNDKLTWVVPVGGSNPISPTPPTSYNADTTMLYDGGRIYVFYRTWIQNPTNEFWIAYKYTTDGITWSSQQYAYRIGETTAQQQTAISPSIVKVGNTYYMFAVDTSNADWSLRKLRVQSSNSLSFSGNWSDCVLDITGTILSEVATNKYYAWHSNIKYINGYYLAIIYVRGNQPSADYQMQQLFLAVSTDRLNFKYSKYPLFAKYPVGTTHWDVGLYRSAIVPKKVGNDVWFDLWYSGWAGEHEVFPTFIGYTEIKKIVSGINHSYTGNTVGNLRTLELSDAIQKINGFTFGDNINRVDGAINPTPCGINYTIATGTPAIVNNYIVNNAASAMRISLVTPVNYELSFDAINGAGVTSSDGGFILYTKMKATAKWIAVYDGTANTKVLKRVSGTTLECDRKTKTFLKSDLNNFIARWEGSVFKYYVNGCLMLEKTFTVSDFVDQADMNDVLGQTTVAFGFVSGSLTKIKNITIKQL